MNFLLLTHLQENGRIMDIIPNDLHQRVPFFIGSKNMVDQLEQLMESAT